MVSSLAKMPLIFNRRLLYLLSRKIPCLRRRSRQISTLLQIPSWHTASITHTQYLYYGTKSKIEQDLPPVSSLLSPYIRTSLTNDLHGNPQNMEFCVSFLGTSSGSPTMHRNGSCTALRLGGVTYLFDVAEGTNRQLIYSRIALSSITKIFISHLHGDHVYGLVPVILEIQVAVKLMKQAIAERSRRTKKRRHHAMVHTRPTLEIYGPPGLYNYVAMNMALSCVKLNYLNVVVTEFVGGREERGPIRSRDEETRNGRRGRRNIFLSHYPEVEMGLLKRRYLEMDAQEKTWIISSPPSIDPDAMKEQQNGFFELSNDVNLLDRQMYITAAEIDHLRGVQTFGYTVKEQTPPGTIDADKAKSFGIAPSKKYSLLKCGIPVMNDDESAFIQPKDVLTQLFRARKFTFLPDHRSVPEPMMKLCTNSDILIHEATLSLQDGLDKIKIRGHNNAYNAGVAGRKSGSQVVVLNHFAGTSATDGGIGIDGIVDEAKSGSRGASEILASFDFMELWVPRGGFQFIEREGRRDCERGKGLLSLLSDQG